MPFEQLKLSNQLCFPVYASSRLIIRTYQPHLDRLGITYPQYLVLMVLWETDNIPVNDIARKLILNTNTITPLLKRMEIQGLLSRHRSGSDERKVIVSLSEIGKDLEIKAAEIPQKLSASLISEALPVEDLIALKDKLHVIIDYLSKKVD